MHKRKGRGKRVEVGGLADLLRLSAQDIRKRDFPEKWKVSFSYVLYKGKNPKVALKEFMQHVSRSGEKGGMTTRSCRHWL